MKKLQVCRLAKKKNFGLKIITLLLLTFFFTSCEKNLTEDNYLVENIEIRDSEFIENYPEVIIENYPQIGEDGKLHFQNEQQLEALLLEIEDLSLLDIYVYNERVGFESSFKKNVDDQENVYRIKNERFASILDTEGECYFIDEGYFYQGNYDFCFLYVPGHKSEIAAFRNDYDAGLFTVTPEVLNQYSDFLLVGETDQESFGEIEIRGTEVRFFPGTEDKRLKGITSSGNYWVYKFIRAKTKAERKGTFLFFWDDWKGLDIDVISVAGECTLEWKLATGGTAQSVVTYSVTEYNKDKAYRTIALAVGGGVSISGGSITPTGIATSFPKVVKGPNSYADHSGTINNVGSVSFTTFW